MGGGVIVMPSSPVSPLFLRQRLGLILGLALAGLIMRPQPTRAADNAPPRAELRQARQLFYESVENRKKIEPAIAAFTAIGRDYPDWQGRVQTYVGALTALKGKHALLPHDKWRLANAGLKIMDAGVAADSTDVESLFIHSSTCFFLPFFFHRGGDAQSKFKKLVALLPDNHGEFERPMLINVLNFLQEHAQLDEEERGMLARLRGEPDLLPAGAPADTTAAEGD